MQTFPIINTLKKYILFVSISPDIEKELENEILEFSKQTRTQFPTLFFLFFKDISQSYLMMLKLCQRL